MRSAPGSTRRAASGQALDHDADLVRAALRRRGLEWNGERDPTPLLVPRGRARAQHYALLAHYSYRLFLRDVLKHAADVRLSLLTRYVSPAVARRYLRFLLAGGLVTRAGRGRYRLRDPRVVSFGGTLEWYVAQVLAREYGCAATWGLRIARAAHGGDYDVVACAEGAVVYVETKSAPPRQIGQEETAAFIDRIETLRPQLALFLVDTTLRMRDKLVPMFAAESARRGLGWQPARLADEVWRVGPEVYLLNADPDLRRTIGLCLATYFRARGIAVPALNAGASGAARSPSARA
jgi:hypothetical protein